MSGLSKMIADFFVRENVIEHEEYEIYKYGSDILIENIGTTIFLICLGFIFNKEISTLIFIAVFAGIRRYSGGYHAKTKLKCYILTITNWAIASVSESSDWYNYQTKEPEGLRKIYLIKHEKK